MGCLAACLQVRERERAKGRGGGEYLIKDSSNAFVCVCLYN